MGFIISMVLACFAVWLAVVVADKIITWWQIGRFE